MFQVAGGLVDLGSGLGISGVFDPSSGTQVSVFSRFFDLTAVTLFVVAGGHRLLLAGVAQSVEAIALDGSIRVSSGLADLAVQTTGRLQPCSSLRSLWG
ncbi:MAG: flagellar biosynthetic protein FliR [Candidatus Poriferisodalaceae bacterium]|jgi:flagellar biosynthesis protein FliR